MAICVFTLQMAWLFAQVLVGNLDTAALKYVFLLKELIDGVQWKEVENFRSLAAIIYPFLEVSDQISLPAQPLSTPNGMLLQLCRIMPLNFFHYLKYFDRCIDHDSDVLHLYLKFYNRFCCLSFVW